MPGRPVVAGTAGSSPVCRSSAAAPCSGACRRGNHRSPDCRRTMAS